MSPKIKIFNPNMKLVPDKRNSAVFKKIKIKHVKK